MARKRERVFALVMALTFFVTTAGVSAAFIYQIILDGRKNKSTVETANAATTGTDDQQNANKLEGTKMQDFTPVATVDKLQVIDLKEGTGRAVQASDTVTVDYTGAVAATGTIFQSSKDMGQPATFPLNGVIAGWTEGMPGMKIGGVRRLIIPAEKAYGATPPDGSGIPANAALVFDIELHSIGE